MRQVHIHTYVRTVRMRGVFSVRAKYFGAQSQEKDREKGRGEGEGCENFNLPLVRSFAALLARSLLA